MGGPGFFQPGIIGQQRADRDPLRPTMAKGEAAKSLLAASKRHTLIYPFLYHMAVPKREVEPISELWQLTGKPTDFVQYALPYEVFVTPTYFSHLGLRGVQVFGVPTSEAKELFTYILSTATFDPSTKETVGIAIQAVHFVDPFFKASKPVDDLSEFQVQVFAFVPVFENRILHWVPNPDGRTLYASPRYVNSDPHLKTMTESLMQGDSDPNAVAEEKHGAIIYGGDAAMEDDPDIEDEDDEDEGRVG